MPGPHYDGPDLRTFDARPSRQLDPAPYLKRLLLVGVEVVAVDQMGARDRAECTAMVVVGQVLDTNPLPPHYSTGMW